MKLGLLPLLLAALTATASIANAAQANVYGAHCAVCHQPNGEGIPGMYPPLANSIGRFAGLDSGRQYLVQVVSFGISGPISVHGQTYDGVMQSWPQLSDEEVAEALNRVLTSFNEALLPKDFHPLQADEVKRIRAKHLSTSDVHKERVALEQSLTKAESHK